MVNGEGHSGAANNANQSDVVSAVRYSVLWSHASAAGTVRAADAARAVETACAEEVAAEQAPPRRFRRPFEKL